MTEPKRDHLKEQLQATAAGRRAGIDLDTLIKNVYTSCRERGDRILLDICELAAMDLAFCKDCLSAAGVSFDTGLTAQEISSIEREYGFRFPPDLREFLGYALPVSKGWVDWRRESRSQIMKRLEWPLEGMCFDIEHNVFWLDSWGARPAATRDACSIARAAVVAAPRLIPVCSHRFLPDRPCEAGNPVFSVYQTDIIYYGSDLFDYLCNEFSYYFGRAEHIFDGRARHIEFWSDLVN